MRTSKLLFGLTLAAGLYACGGETKTDETTESTATEATYTVDPAASTVNWKGTMVGMYSHSGDIKLSNGSLLLAGDQVKGGTFTVDMKSINPTDSAYSPEHPRADLIGHLGTGDFFSVDSIPTATFTIKSVEGNVATGDLTVKGKTNEEKLQIESVEVADKKVTAKGKLTFNRQNYGVAYKATMKDMVLSDDIELMVTVIANQ